MDGPLTKPNDSYRDSVEGLTPEEIFARGASSLDPRFRELRRKHFEKNGRWKDFEIPGGARLFLAESRLKMGPIPCRALLPAFGWETRPLDQHLSLGVVEWKEALGKLKAAKDWDVVQLTSILPAEAQALAQAVKGTGIRVLEAPFPVRVVTNRGGYAEYLKSRSQSSNKDLRRALNYAAKNEITYRTQLSWAEIEPIFAAKVVRGGGGEDYTKTGEFLAFFKEFREEMLRAGKMLELGVFLRDILIGFDLGFWSGKVLHAYQTAYLPRFSDYRPGALAFEKLIEHGLEAGAAQIDFMGDYPYMKLYSKEVLDLRKITLLAPSPRGIAVSALLYLKSRLSRSNKA